MRRIECNSCGAKLLVSSSEDKIECPSCMSELLVSENPIQQETDFSISDKEPVYAECA